MLMINNFSLSDANQFSFSTFLFSYFVSFVVVNCLIRTINGVIFFFLYQGTIDAATSEFNESRWLMWSDLKRGKFSHAYKNRSIEENYVRFFLFCVILRENCLNFDIYNEISCTSQLYNKFRFECPSLPPR